MKRTELLEELSRREPDRKAKRLEKDLYSTLTHIPPDLAGILMEHPISAYREALASDPDLDPDLLSRLSGPDQPDRIRETVAENAGASVSLLRKLLADPSPAVRLAAARNRNLPAEDLEFVKLEDEIFPRLRLRPDCPPIILHAIAESGDEDARERVAKHANAAAATLAILSLGDHTSFRDMMHAAANEEDSVDGLLEIIQKTGFNARHAVASNPNADTETLRRLMDLGDEAMVSHIAVNPATPAELLEDIAKLTQIVERRNGNGERTRKGLSEHENTTPEILRGLLAHEDCRGALAENPKTPADILTELAKIDEDIDLQTVLANRGIVAPERMASLLAEKAEAAVREDDAYTTRSIAENPYLAPETMRSLSRYDEDDTTKIHLASNSKLPLDIAREMIENEEWDRILANLARRPDLPLEALHRIAEKEPELNEVNRISNTIAEVERAPTETLELLLYKAPTKSLVKHPNITEEQQGKALRHTLEYSGSDALFAAQNYPHLKEFYLEFLARQDSDYLNLLVLLLPETSRETVLRFSDSEDPIIQGAVALHPGMS